MIAQLLLIALAAPGDGPFYDEACFDHDISANICIADDVEIEFGNCAAPDYWIGYQTSGTQWCLTSTNVGSGVDGDVFCVDDGDDIVDFTDGAVFGDTVTFNGANAVVLAATNDAVTPSLTLEPGSGWYSSADGVLNVAINGADEWEITNTFLRSKSGTGSPAARDLACTYAHCVNYTWVDDITSGMGRAGSGNPAMVALGETIGSWVNGGTGGNKYLVIGDSLTVSGTDDYTQSITATLNNNSAGGSDTFRLLKGVLTETDSSGWNSVYLMDLIVGSTSKFKVYDSGDTVITGTLKTEVATGDAPAEPHACDAAHSGVIVTVDDTNDTAYNEPCVCLNLDGTGYDWRQLNNVTATACPYF